MAGIKNHAHFGRWALLALSFGALVVCWSWAAHTHAGVLRAAGYWALPLLSCAFVVCAVCNRSLFGRFLRFWGKFTLLEWGLLASLCAGLCWLGSMQASVLDKSQVRVLGLAQGMHLERSLLCPTRAHDVRGVFTLLDGTLETRDLGAAFLLSLVHDIFGYRVGNMQFATWLAVAGCLLGGLAFGWCLGGRRIALLGAGLSAVLLLFLFLQGLSLWLWSIPVAFLLLIAVLFLHARPWPDFSALLALGLVLVLAALSGIPDISSAPAQRDFDLRRQALCEGLDRSGTLIISREPAFWIAHGFAAVSPERARASLDRLAFHFRVCSFRQVLVVQALDPSPLAAHLPSVLPCEDLGPSFQLDVLPSVSALSPGGFRVARLTAVHSSGGGLTENRAVDFNAQFPADPAVAARVRKDYQAVFQAQLP